jgi:hypothetical protein
MCLLLLTSILCVHLQEYGQEFQLAVGAEFNSFQEAEYWIKEYAKQQHFVVVKTRPKRNKEGHLIKRTFQCERSGKRRSRATGSETSRNKGTKRCKCQWHVNLSQRGSVVRITTMLNEHNHECNVATDTFACANRCLTEEMNEMIYEYTIYGHLDAGAQVALLRAKFPERYAFVNLLLR